jgi:hypothetical protein
MTKIQHPEKFLRERKMLLMLPVIVVPLLLVAFVGLGGGTDAGKKADLKITQGLNMNLPTPHFDTKEKPMDKLGSYKKADLDSAKLRERMKEDPYIPAHALTPDLSGSHLMPLGGRKVSVVDSQANQVLERLKQLKQVIASSPIQSAGPPPITSPARLFRPVVPKDTVSPDPQLEKLSGMLDKILRIQHPDEGMKEDSTHSVTTPPVMEVTALNQRESGKVLTAVVGREDDEAEEGFMDLDNSPEPAAPSENLISAVIDQDEVLTAGATVGLRLIQDAEIGGLSIPRNSLLSGKVSVNGERFWVAVNSIRVQHTVLPVSLEVYDQDGLPGIRIPGSIGRDVAKESAGEAVSGLNVSPLDPLTAQAAGVGLQAARSMITRKAKLVREAVPAGYRVFLKNVGKK